MVRQQRGDAIFRIVGRSPTAEVRRLARLPGVEVLGEVRDVGEQIDRFSLSVAPLRIGRGVQNKVLESMAAGKPVVLTTAAAEGLKVRDQVDCVIADSPEVMAAQVVRLLADTEARIRIGRYGRGYVRRDHRWPDALAELQRVIEDRPPAACELHAAPPVAEGYRGANSLEQSALRSV